MSSKLRILLVIALALIGIIQMASSASCQETSASLNRGLFAADLFRQITKSKNTVNVILSPISIQSALAMLYLGAAGQTATELQNGLRLPSSNKEEVGKYFAEILKKNNGEAELRIANKLFVNTGYKLLPSFNDLAKKYFNSTAETVDFKESSNAINTINTWVEKQTNNKITNIMQPGSVNADTSALIVNAIYFKGKWQKPLSKDLTRKSPFWISKTKSVDVDTMYGDERFNYAELPELDATAVEMLYKDSNISMVIILPNERDGLAKLEEKLSSVAINQLSSKMTVQSVNLFMPKFKIEFETGLTDDLKAMGIHSIFENVADLSGIFESGPRLKVSDVRHKAFIDVNEAGSEAAAATIVKITPMSLNFNQKNFVADHPFVFAIKSSEAIYFVGHVTEP